MPPRSAKKQAPLPGMFKANKRVADSLSIHDFDLLEAPKSKKQARMPPPPPAPAHVMSDENRSGVAFATLDALKIELNNRFQAMNKEIDRATRDDLGSFLGDVCDSIGKKASTHLEVLNDSIKNSMLAQQQIAENHIQAMKAIKAAYEEEMTKAAEKDDETVTLIQKVGHAAKIEAQALLDKYVQRPGGAAGSGSFAMA